MLRKTLLHFIVNKPRDCKVLSVRNSALFINGAKASENFVYVIPYIDFPEQIKHKHIIEDNLLKRKSNIDLNKVENLWSMYEDLKQRKSEYDKKKEEISRELGKLIKSDPEGQEVKRLKIKVDLLKDNIRKLKGPLWSAEEAAILEVLKIPNTLHPQTSDVNKILHTHLSPPSGIKDHLNIGADLGIIEFKKNENYYLKGDGAIFELGAMFYFNEELRRNKFHQFSNPDFVKSVIVEGCGLDHSNPDSTFILHHNENTKVNPDSRLHLTGGGHLCSFLAYYAKNILYSKALPLRYFSMGRRYQPSPIKEDSLFHVSQSSVVQVFGAGKNAEETDMILQELIDILKSVYSQLGYHFRINLVSADKLFMWESLRVAVEMYSTSLNKYVEVANISVSGDFISKRLMFTYVENKQGHFPHIISGTVLNVPKFLACILEQDANFVLPEQFRVENWICN
ncbi:serine--tRNA synthetase-like protein Slimp [Plodia interpunctella]|uniref:serine--tRNA synthetase-like protein Slimp n=1 Tax=Plodia interpunctella TaxID=58824 RepID=UPI002368BF10|nr:serine--tRNA synthetase-like protein Slimp [Plodia interpunctella]